MIYYRQASLEDLEKIWNYNIAQNPDEPRNQRWKESYMERNRDGRAVTYVIIDGNEPIGEVTLDFYAESYGKPETRSKLADSHAAAYITALRIRKEYEGKGLGSGLMQYLENSAKQMGFQILTIGVEAKETRNLAIYLHWGYNRFITAENDGGELVLFYGKEI